jgi:hypothetical protein
VLSCEPSHRLALQQFQYQVDGLFVFTIVEYTNSARMPHSIRG